MKLSSYILSSLAVLAGLASCSNDTESTAVDGQGSGSAVVVNASVGKGSIFTRSNPIGTEAEQAAFNTGDQISITDLSNPGGEKTVNYELGANGWNPITTGEFLTWHSATQNFHAYYPLKCKAAFVINGTLDITSYQTNSFANGYVADDQRVLEALQSSDFMTAETPTAVKEDATHVLPLEFNRQTARIVVNVVGYNDQYSADETAVQGVWLRAADKTSNKTSLASHGINAYAVPNASEGVLQQFVSLVCPTEKMDNELFMTLYVDNKDEEIDYDNYAGAQRLNITGIPELEAGKSYTYNVTVGKNAVKVNSVTVADWGEETLLPSSGYADRDNSSPYSQVGQVITSQGHTFSNVAAAQAANETPVAMVAYLGYDTGDPNYHHGLAISLKNYVCKSKDGTRDYLLSAYYWYNGIETKNADGDIRIIQAQNFVKENKIPNGCGNWRLPNANDIKHIFAACDGTAYVKGAPEDQQSLNPGMLNQLLQSVGGEQMECSTNLLNGTTLTVYRMLLGDGTTYLQEISPKDSWYFDFSTNKLGITIVANNGEPEIDDRNNNFPRMSRLIFPF